MSEFTYEMPFPNEKLFAGIIYQLKRDNQYDIANLLKGCHLEVEECGYSHYNGGGRWDAHSAYAIFYVNPANIDFLDTPDIKRRLVDICDDIIPVSVGFDVKDAYFPNREFIIPKLNEMADCRNLIAHNSYVGDTERNLMKTYYNVILKQISAYYDN